MQRPLDHPYSHPFVYKGWFSGNRRHNQKYCDLVIMKTALFPMIIFFINPVAYNLVMSRLSELQAEVGSQIVGICVSSPWFPPILFLCLRFLNSVDPTISEPGTGQVNTIHWKKRCH